MIITNKHNLPEAVYKVLSKDRYDGGSKPSSYSVTSILNPPRIVHLSKRHSSKLEEDAIDRVWSLFGQIAHSLLEEHAADESLSEQRLYLKILDRDISGQVDSYHDGIISDYKVTSAWGFVHGTLIQKWEEQLNMYAYLCIKNNMPVRSLQIVAIFRDWDKHKAKEVKYPNNPLMVIPITLWELDKQESYFTKKLAKLIANEQLPDDLLTLCSEEDMWQRPDVYAMMKKGRKTAVKLFPTLSEAEAWHSNSCDYNATNDTKDCDCRKEHYIVTRTGDRVRCRDYCSCSKFCNIYKEYCDVLDQRQAE